MTGVQELERVMMPGKIYDIVRHHEGIAFGEARHLIQKSKVKVIESSGNVFRQCLKPLSDSEAHAILQRSYMKTKKENLKLTYLTKINNDGLYESTSHRFYGSTSQRLNEFPTKIPDTLVELECFYESTVRGLAEGEAGLQGFDLANPPASALKTMPYHTSPKLNPRLEEKHGINVPIFRIGTRHSFEEMHKTFGLLDRADALRWGASRLWLVVQLNFQRPLELRLACQLTRRGGYPPWCSMPTYHKEFVVLPSLLRKWGIPYEIIVQRAGDLVHLRDWVPHQILDLGTNISETVSIGSVEWNMSADNSSFLNCPCGTKYNVGDNNFGKNTVVYGRVELMVPRSKPMPCTHVVQAIEAAKKEYNVAAPGYNRYLRSNYNAVPVLKEYRKSTRTIRSKGTKCYGCGRRSDDLKAHLNRHIMCRAKLNLSKDEDKGEEPVTDESDVELTYGQAPDDDNDDGKFRCSHCTRAFEHRIQLTKHVVLLHKQNLSLKRSAEDAGPIIKKRKTKKQSWWVVGFAFISFLFRIVRRNTNFFFIFRNGVFR